MKKVLKKIENRLTSEQQQWVTTSEFCARPAAEK